MSSLMTDTAELTDVLRKTLDRSPTPLPPNKVASQLTGPFRTPKERVAELLADMAAQGRVHEFAPYRTPQKRYWTRDVNTYIRDTLLEALSKKSLTRSELKSSYKNLLRGISENRIKAVFNDLVATNEVRKLPAHIGARTERFSRRPVNVTEYTDDAIDKLSKKLADHGVTREQIIAAVAARHAPATSPEEQPAAAAAPAEAPGTAPLGATPSAATSPPAPAAEDARPAATHQDAPGNSVSEGESPRELSSLHDQILERLREDMELHRSSVALVADLRRALDFQNLTKAEFDGAVLELRRQQRIELYHADGAAALAPEKRDELVRDPQGNHYNVIAFRRQH